MQSERRSLEEEYDDLRNKKESIAQWEAQITEIIQWLVFKALEGSQDTPTCVSYFVIAVLTAYKELMCTNLISAIYLHAHVISSEHYLEL